MQTSLFRVTVWLSVLSVFIHGFSFTSAVDKNRCKVGEKVVLTLTFCYDDLEEYTLEEPQLQHFNIVLLSEEEKEEGNLSCVKQRYSMTAKKEGDYILPAYKAHIESIPLSKQKLYNKNHYLEKVDIFTKPLSLHVTALPHGLHVFGQYQLIARVDTTEVKAQKPLHFTVELQGKGNIENIDFLDLNIPHTLIYPHQTKTLSKTFDIVSDTNYTIPAISLTYFNQANQTVEIITTKSYSIAVTHSATKKSNNLWVIVLLTGIYGSLLFYVFFMFKQLAYIDEKQMLFKRISRAKDKEELLKVITPYMLESKGMQRVVYRLEKSEKYAFKALQKETTTQIHLLTQN